MTAVRAMAKIAHLHSKCNHVERADAILQSCLGAASELVGTHHVEYGVLLFQLGSLYQRGQQFSKAIGPLQQCCDVYNQHRIGVSPSQYSRNCRAASIASRSSFRSLLFSPTAATTTRDSFHRSATHASALLSLGMCQHCTGDIVGARRSLEEAVSLQASTGGKYTSVYVSAARHLAAVLLACGDVSGAEALARECCALCPVVMGPESLEHATALQLQADIAMKQRHTDTAIACLQACVNIRKGVLGA